MFNTLILLIIVLMVFYKLKSVLGTKPDNALSREEAAKLFNFIVKQTDAKTSDSNSDVDAVIVDLSDPIDQALAKVPNFNKERFLSNAKKAFEIISSSFSKGDTKTLESLVSKSLAKKFQAVIEQRKTDGIVAETDLVSFESAEIADASLSKSNVAKIAVKFITEQVNTLRNAKNEIIEGDENFIQKITDIWTFERSLSSSNPTWLLVSTKK